MQQQWIPRDLVSNKSRTNIQHSLLSSTLVSPFLPHLHIYSIHVNTHTQHKKTQRELLVLDWVLVRLKRKKCERQREVFLACIPSNFYFAYKADTECSIKQEQDLGAKIKRQSALVSRIKHSRNWNLTFIFQKQNSRVLQFIALPVSLLV